MGITASLSLMGLDKLVANYRLTGVTREIAREIQLARSKAIMEKNSFGLYVDFQRDSYIFFRDNNRNNAFDSNDLVIFSRNLSSLVDLYSGCFDICAGEKYNPKQLTIMVYEDGSTNGSGENFLIIKGKKGTKTTRIYVRAATGRIRIEGL